jgi:F0F1-type ATP synthase assembly protein I
MKTFNSLRESFRKLTTPWALLVGLVIGFMSFAVILLVGAVLPENS